ncbi:MAG: hypothetical protein ACYCT9_06390 [Leptospirillum sp.]
MGESSELGDALWALLVFLDPEDTGAISGEPWTNPQFDLLVERLSGALSRTSFSESKLEEFLVLSALMDRTTHLIEGLVSPGGELMGRLNALSRLIKAPYAQKAMTLPPEPSAFSKRI